MGSLLSKVLDGEFVYEVPESVGLLQMRELMEDCRKSLFSAKNIDITSVFDDIYEAADGDDKIRWIDFKFDALPARLKPPFPSMWLEGRFKGHRYAIYCAQDTDALALTMLTEDSVTGKAIWGIGVGVLRLTPEGGHSQSGWRALGGFDDDKLHWLFGVAVHSILRMNCANVSLVERPSGAKSKGLSLIPKTPRIVWHEISIGSQPIKQGDVSEGTGIERRVHGVRGHYADYTKGRGLFGKESLKQVFWVPAHLSGSPVAGIVVSKYKIISST